MERVLHTRPIPTTTIEHLYYKSQFHFARHCYYYYYVVVRNTIINTTRHYFIDALFCYTAAENRKFFPPILRDLKACALMLYFRERKVVNVHI